MDQYVDQRTAEIFEAGLGPADRTDLRDLIVQLIDEAAAFGLDEEHAVTDFIWLAVPMPRTTERTQWPDAAEAEFALTFRGQQQRVAAAKLAVDLDKAAQPFVLDDETLAAIKAAVDTP